MKERDARMALRTRFISNVLKQLDQVIAMANYADESDILEAARGAKLTAEKAMSRSYETLPSLERRSIEQLRKRRPSVRWDRPAHR